MKIFRFDKKVFFAGLTILSSFANAYSLNATPLRSQVNYANGDEPVFFHVNLKQVNALN